MDFKDIILTDIVSSSIINAKKGRRLTINDRPTFALHFTIAGKITYTHNGEKLIATSDCAVILPMHATYELYNNEGGRFSLINFLCKNNSFNEKFLTKKISSVDSYLEDFEKIRNLFPLKDNRLRALSVMYRIFDRLSSEENPVSLILSPAIKHMNEHLSDQKVTNDVLAGEAHISEIYLRTLFKKHYGTSPHQCLISLRIEKAKQMLIETDEPVQDIAQHCGFSGIYHFTRAFG